MISILRYLASRNDRLLHGALALGSGLALWALRTPGLDSILLAAITILFVLAPLLIVIRILVRMILAWKRRPDTPRVFEGASTWGLFFCVTVGLVALAFYQLPFKAALALSRPSLERFAKASTPGQRSSGPCWVGLFSFSYIVHEGDRLQLTFGKSEIPWGKHGLYYSLSGNPVESSHYYSQESLGGGWHQWHYGGW
ncbi:hypothetical protein OKA05_27720 [Luteolibacter arcticus]|uniref:Uncharacterized protein n=1 Tax=Luteolibacter arcticus TaxID=1581411 RepID=A0ABT3GS71_9BACT|nr:hypothetical protein [Luteolibacter arcticus]MCW1926371.1 hypothetical protein [Luteolibacter arcticus]